MPWGLLQISNFLFLFLFFLLIIIVDFDYILTKDKQIVRTQAAHFLKLMQ